MAEYQGCEIPEDPEYGLDYCRVKPLGDGTLRVGLTESTQPMAGRLLYVTFRSPGTHRARRRPLARWDATPWRHRFGTA